MKWYNIIIIGLIICGVIFVQRKFFPEQIITSHTDTVYVQHVDTFITEKLVPYAVKVPEVDTVFIPLDSAALVARYLALHKELYTKRYYKEIYKIDTIGTASIKGRVFLNKLDSLEFTYNIKTPTIINTQIVANPKNSLYIGGEIGVRNFSPMLIWNNKDKVFYTVSYNLIAPSVSIGVAVNINRLKFK